jgi:hypothetical protein
VKSGGDRYRDKHGRPCNNRNQITYSIEFGQGIKSSSGRKKLSGKIKEGESKSYTIMVQ